VLTCSHHTRLSETEYRHFMMMTGFVIHTGKSNNHADLWIYIPKNMEVRWTLFDRAIILRIEKLKLKYKTAISMLLSLSILFSEICASQIRRSLYTYVLFSLMCIESYVCNIPYIEIFCVMLELSVHVKTNMCTADRRPQLTTYETRKLFCPFHANNWSEMGR
jgi:hypothetical protein